MTNISDGEAAALFPEGSSSRVLRFLWSSKAEWSGREIARKVGLSAPGCHAALKRLAARGLVHFRRVSNVHLYKINPDSYMVQKMFARLFEAEAAMGKEIDSAIRAALAPAKADVVSVVLFGSRARGTEKLGSDLDLLIVTSSKEGGGRLEPRLEKLRQVLFRRFNVSLAPYVQTLSELKRKHARGLPLVEEILKDGRALYGKPLKELLT